MRTFLNRLKDSGWRNINVRNYTDNDNQVLKRGDKSILCVEQINLDGTSDIHAQINGLFKYLIELIERSRSREIFLPGGGEIPIPDFFIDYCKINDILIHVILEENLDNYRYYDN